MLKMRIKRQRGKRWESKEGYKKRVYGISERS